MKESTKREDSGPDETAPTTNEETYRLPNGRCVFHHNKHETNLIYKELFEERIYLKHGIVLNPGACVFDVGANIGLFTLFVKQECHDAIILAFEPTPELFEILCRNVSPYGGSVISYQAGLSDREGVATFTYYPHYSIMSGFHADPLSDGVMLSSGIRNQLPKAAKVPESYISAAANQKLRRKQVMECKLETISGILASSAIERVDLLKIDAERSELAILRGIAEADWSKIQQIVIEVHDAESLESVGSMFQQHGLSMEVEQEGQFANSGVFNCFGIRR